MSRLIVFMCVFTFLSSSKALVAWPGIVAEIGADVDAVQDQIANNGGDQNLNNCDNCHGNGGEIDLTDNFFIEDSEGNALNLGTGGDEYVPGDVYTIRMRVFMPDNAAGKRFRGAYRILAFGNNTGTFSNVPVDAYGEGDNTLAHFVDRDILPGDAALTVVDEDFWEVSVDWTAPNEGTTVQFNLFSMGSNGNDTAEDVDGIGNNEASVGATSNLSLLGPASGSSSDIPDLVDPDSGSDDEGSDAVSNSGSDSDTNSSVQVTSFNGGCGATSAPVSHSSPWLLLLVGAILLSFSRLRALTFLPIKRR